MPTVLRVKSLYTQKHTHTRSCLEWHSRPRSQLLFVASGGIASIWPVTLAMATVAFLICLRTGVIRWLSWLICSRRREAHTHFLLSDWYKHWFTGVFLLCLLRGSGEVRATSNRQRKRGANIIKVEDTSHGGPFVITHTVSMMMRLCFHNHSKILFAIDLKNDKHPTKVIGHGFSNCPLMGTQNIALTVTPRRLSLSFSCMHERSVSTWLGEKWFTRVQRTRNCLYS